jgi:hypothetical protein
MLGNYRVASRVVLHKVSFRVSYIRGSRKGGPVVIQSVFGDWVLKIWKFDLGTWTTEEIKISLTFTKSVWAKARTHLTVSTTTNGQDRHNYMFRHQCIHKISCTLYNPSPQQNIQTTKNKLSGLSPWANYKDREAKLEPTFADRLVSHCQRDRSPKVVISIF